MGNGIIGVEATVIRGLDNRVKEFAKYLIERSIQKMPIDILAKAKEHGLVEVIHCTDENIEVWEHLPVELGDDIYMLIKELD